ncbi:MAG: hypothetical protein ABIL58_09025 [Pseudomonadota bacterium]
MAIFLRPKMASIDLRRRTLLFAFPPKDICGQADAANYVGRPANIEIALFLCQEKSTSMIIGALCLERLRRDCNRVLIAADSPPALVLSRYHPAGTPFEPCGRGFALQVVHFQVNTSPQKLNLHSFSISPLNGGLTDP